MLNYYSGHMWGWGVTGWFMMVAFWAIVILLVVWLMKSGKERNCRNAIDILKERYAKGEINKEEFEAKYKELS